jgi:hypothetical protein
LDTASEMNDVAFESSILQSVLSMRPPDEQHCRHKSALRIRQTSFDTQTIISTQKEIGVLQTKKVSCDAIKQSLRGNLILQLTIDKLFALFQRKIHKPIQARENAVILDATVQFHDHPLADDLFQKVTASKHMSE